MTIEQIDAVRTAIDYAELANDIMQYCGNDTGVFDFTKELEVLNGYVNITLSFCLDYKGHLIHDASRINPPEWHLDYFSFSLLECKVIYTDADNETDIDLSILAGISEKQLTRELREIYSE